MQNPLYLLLVLTLLTTKQLSAQVVVTQEPESSTPKDTVVLIEPVLPAFKLEESGLIFLFNRSYTFRNLQTNEGLFGDTLGERAKEYGLNTWSYGLGFRSKVASHVFIGAGINLLQHGEQYAFKAADSTYSYSSIYRYTAMPLFVQYVTGKKLELTATLGVMPAMFFNYRRFITYTNPQNVETSETVEANNGDQRFTSTVLFTFASVGAQYQFSPNWKIFAQPEFRYQLGSSYTKTNPFKHQSYAIGASMGLVYLL